MMQLYSNIGCQVSSCTSFLYRRQAYTLGLTRSEHFMKIQTILIQRGYRITRCFMLKTYSRPYIPRTVDNQWTNIYGPIYIAYGLPSFRLIYYRTFNASSCSSSHVQATEVITTTAWAPLTLPRNFHPFEL